MNYIYYLKSAFKKMRARDKNEAGSRLTPMERQAVTVMYVVVIFPLMIFFLTLLSN